MAKSCAGNTGATSRMTGIQGGRHGREVVRPSADGGSSAKQRALNHAVGGAWPPIGRLIACPLPDRLSPEVALSQNATPDSQSAPFVCARRQVLLGASVGGVVLVAAACGGSSSSSGSTAPAASGTSGAGATGFIALSKIPSDSSVSVKDPTGRILLMTQSGGKLTALDSTCTHQGCTVAPDGSQLTCPCHGSQYSLTGAVKQGPATIALHTVAVKVVAGQVQLA
jgi:cytochrome b6-f complex iron-sulfur subunit